jgi:hypothetical protein
LAYSRSERPNLRFLLCYLIHMYINLSKALQSLQPHMYTHGDAPLKGQSNKPRDQLTEPGQRKPTASFHDKFSSPHPVFHRKGASHRSILIVSPIHLPVFHIELDHVTDSSTVRMKHETREQMDQRKCELPGLLRCRASAWSARELSGLQVESTDRFLVQIRVQVK